MKYETFTPSEINYGELAAAAFIRLSDERKARVLAELLHVNAPEIRRDLILASDEMKILVPPQFADEAAQVREERDDAIAAEKDAAARKAEKSGNMKAGHQRRREGKAEAEAGARKKAEAPQKAEAQQNKDAGAAAVAPAASPGDKPSVSLPSQPDTRSTSTTNPGHTTHGMPGRAGITMPPSSRQTGSPVPPTTPTRPDGGTDGR